MEVPKQPTQSPEQEREEREKDRLWEEESKNEILQRLKQGESLQLIMNSMENLDEAFENTPDTLICSDGRVSVSNGTKIGIAGQGILLSPEQYEKFVGQYKGKIKKVGSHSECGAAGVYAKAHGINNSDRAGEEFTRKLAEDLGAEYFHIDPFQFKCSHHNERAIVLDATGMFCPEKIGAMPAHFLSSGAGMGLDEEYVGKEIEILSGIAFGGHGFGDRFTEENPFHIFISAQNERQRDRFIEIARKALSKFGNRVKIDGFIYDKER